MKRFQSHRYPSLSNPVKVGIVIAIVLLLSNMALVYFLVKEKTINKNLILLVDKTNNDFNQIHESLKKKDLQSAFRHLTEAQKQMASMSPSQPSPTQQARVETKEMPPAHTTKAKATTQPLPAIPASGKEAPYPFVFADEGEYLLVCEKDTKTIYIFQFLEGKFTYVKHYSCLIGANNHDKRREGDFATPEGVYFFRRFAPGKTLAENYGYGAFVLNYPNFLDRKERKDGSGIWIHGHSIQKSIGVDVLDTKGCVVVSNDVLKEMSEFLQPNGTPIAIVNKLHYVNLENQNQLSRELRNFIDSWRRSWESIDTKKYLSFYSSAFVNSEGMDYHAFARHKEKINKTKKFIRVNIENLAILVPPEHGGNIAVARYHQRYSSNNFKSDSKKIFYLKKGQSGWQIIGESLY